MRRGTRGRVSRERGRRRTAARSRAIARASAKAPQAELTLAGMLDYAAMMEEPLELALDLTRGLNLAAQSLDDRNSGRALLALGRAASSELHKVKGMLATLMKVRAEREP